MANSAGSPGAGMGKGLEQTHSPLLCDKENPRGPCLWPGTMFSWLCHPGLLPAQWWILGPFHIIMSSFTLPMTPLHSPDGSSPAQRESWQGLSSEVGLGPWLTSSFHRLGSCWPPVPADLRLPLALSPCSPLVSVGLMTLLTSGPR